MLTMARTQVFPCDGMPYWGPEMINFLEDTFSVSVETAGEWFDFVNQFLGEDRSKLKNAVIENHINYKNNKYFPGYLYENYWAERRAEVCYEQKTLFPQIKEGDKYVMKNFKSSLSGPDLAEFEWYYEKEKELLKDIRSTPHVWRDRRLEWVSSTYSPAAEYLLMTSVGFSETRFINNS